MIMIIVLIIVKIVAIVVVIIKIILMIIITIIVIIIGVEPLNFKRGTHIDGKIQWQIIFQTNFCEFFKSI